jgi:hypothetical protein
MLTKYIDIHEHICLHISVIKFISNQDHILFAGIDGHN